MRPLKPTLPPTSTPQEQPQVRARDQDDGWSLERADLDQGLPGDLVEALFGVLEERHAGRPLVVAVIRWVRQLMAAAIREE